MSADESWAPTATRWTDAADAGSIVEYVEGGFGDAPARNVADWQRWRIRPRAFADVRSVQTETRILGRDAPGPLLVAPTHGHHLLHDDGERATAEGARRAGVPFVHSQGSGTHVDELRAPFLQQVYLPEDRAAAAPFLDAAAAAGASAFVVTVDQAAVGGDRFRLDVANALGRLPRPHAHLLGEGISRHIRPDDLTWIRDRWHLPVFAKGVLDPRSARIAIDAGAAGVVVSNHGGRQLAWGASPALVLAEIADAVDGQGAVWADSGIRTGSDVFRALALGADAVLVGRPVLRGLAADGADGVERALSGIIDDLRVVMANAGTSDLGDVDRRRLVEA